MRKPVPRHAKPALAAIPGEGELQAELLRLETQFSHLGHDGPAALNEALAKARAAGDAGLLARALSLMARADIFRGRIERDDWLKQAKALAKGGVEEYRKVFGKDPR